MWHNLSKKYIRYLINKLMNCELNSLLDILFRNFLKNLILAFFSFVKKIGKFFCFLNKKYFENHLIRLILHY